MPWKGEETQAARWTSHHRDHPDACRYARRKLAQRPGLGATVPFHCPGEASRKHSDLRDVPVDGGRRARATFSGGAKEAVRGDDQTQMAVGLDLRVRGVDVVWSDPTLRCRNGFIRSNVRAIGPPHEHYAKETVTSPRRRPVYAAPWPAAYESLRPLAPGSVVVRGVPSPDGSKPGLRIPGT